MNTASDRASLQSDTYSLLPCDLRNLASTSTIMAKLERVLDPNVDTLILAECVLAYLSQESSIAMLEQLSSILNRPFALCYEMCVAGDDHVETPSDPTPPSKFGAVMLNNLQVSL